jgi:hypothetical protein
MVIDSRTHATQHTQMARDLRQPRHKLTQLKAGHAGADGLELAANFGRRCRLEIISVQVAGSAFEENQDHRLGAGVSRWLLGLEAEEVGQR